MTLELHAYCVELLSAPLHVAHAQTVDFAWPVRDDGGITGARLIRRCARTKRRVVPLERAVVHVCVLHRALPVESSSGDASTIRGRAHLLPPVEASTNGADMRTRVHRILVMGGVWALCSASSARAQ